MNESRHLLAVDVGNTATGIALFRRGRIVWRRHLTTPARVSKKYFQALLPQQARQDLAVVISSVVPGLNRPLRTMFHAAGSDNPLFVSHRLATGLTWAIDRPVELGADRIADCVGALSLFRPPFIVIDSGTAITFDLVDRQCRHIGGAILPGAEIALRSLAENTAKLKKIGFAIPASAVGSNTVTNIRSGIFYGILGGMKMLIAEYRKVLGKGCRIVGTGGLILHFLPYLAEVDQFEPDLIFFGLQSIFQRNSTSRSRSLKGKPA